MQMSRQRGIAGENLAADFLQKNGFEILQRNFYSRFGEIDIVAKKFGVLHFVEVKSGSFGGEFDPIFKITPAKIKKLIKTIDFYFVKNPSNLKYSLDALIIKFDGKSAHFDLIENITQI